VKNVPRASGSFPFVSARLRGFGDQQSNAVAFSLRGCAFVTICDKAFVNLCENMQMSGELQTFQVAASRMFTQRPEIRVRFRIPSLAPAFPITPALVV
jgi:hypothetical protein